MIETPACAESCLLYPDAGGGLKYTDRDSARIGCRLFLSTACNSSPEKYAASVCLELYRIPESHTLMPAQSQPFYEGLKFHLLERQSALVKELH